MAQTGGRRAKAGKRTPKGATVKRTGHGATASGRVTPKPSNRYTPPVPRTEKVSPKWVPILMFALLIAGMGIIVCNYLELLPGGAKNWYLLAGLGCITGGFITSTNYR
ncbi:MAG: cell division protein CrgA [Acidimicrobiales bacterium]